MTFRPPAPGQPFSALRDSLNAQFDTPSVPPAQAATIALDAPPLDDLVVEVPQLPPPGKQELAARFARLQRLASAPIPRRMGRPVEEGDEVLVDLIVWTQGTVTPLSPRHQVWLTDDDDGGLPGLRDALVGWKVGAADTLNTVLEEPALRSLIGQPAVVSVVIHAAQGRDLLDPESPALLGQLGLGATLNEVFRALGKQALEQHQRDQETLLRLEVLNALTELQEQRIPPAAIEAELRDRFERTDGAALKALQLPLGDQSAARDRFLKTPELREHAAHAVCVGALLGAIAKRDDVRVGPKDVADFIDGFAQASGQSGDAVLQGVTSGTNIDDDLVRQLLYIKSIAHVVEAAQITVEDG